MCLTPRPNLIDRAARHRAARHRAARHCAPGQRGLTLVEMLVAITIMALLAGAMAALASAVHSSTEYSAGQSVATQHARVALERITRAVSQAHAVDSHPGFAVAPETIDGWKFCDTLLVWKPDGEPANEAGPPLVRELVIFSPDPVIPTQLLEITAPDDNRALPLDANLSQSPWRELIAEIKSSDASRRVVLTNLLRAAPVSNGGTDDSLRGAVWFEQQLRPSAANWDDYQTGALSWQSLPWPQGIYGSKTGMRQNRVQIELQLVPGNRANSQTDASQVIPFLGSASVYYQIER